MKKMCQKHGLTLVELIVASLLIAIVLLGVVAFNVSLKQIQDKSFNQSTLGIQAGTAMNYLNDDIAMTTGSPIDKGVQTLNGTTPPLCLRQPDATPLNMNDNPWICYFLDSADNNLKRCSPKIIGTPPTSPTGCNNPVINLVKLQSGSFFQLDTPNPGFIRITLNAQDGTGYYTMSTDIYTVNNH